MPKSASPAVVSGLVLASVRQPGEKTLCDIFITDGKVAQIVPSGPQAEFPPGSRVVDLDGRYVIPGLWDEHVHMTQWALAAGRIDLSGASSAREAAAVVRSRRGASTPVESGGDPAGGRTLVGVGFRDAVWADTPSLELLDGATAGVPTALISHDLH